MGRLLVLALATTGTPAPSEGETSHELEALEAELERFAAERRFAGVVAIARGDELLYVGAHGAASLELGVPHAKDTRFELHSLSKPLLATTVLRGVDDGRLGLDDLVGEHLSGWPLGWSVVTVRHLLSHRSGVPELDESFLAAWRGSARETWEALADDLAGSETGFEPGTGWRYSNGGYVLLAAVLETVWELPLAEVLRRELFEPAGMTASVLETVPRSATVYDGHVVIPGLASGYNGSPEVLQVASSKTWAIPGAGGIVSSAPDLLAFARALFGGSLLEPDTLAEMLRVEPGREPPYALGWFVRERDGRTFVSHTGGTNGFVTSLEHEPETGLTFVVLSNLGFAPLQEIRERVAASVPR